MSTPSSTLQPLSAFGLDQAPAGEILAVEEGDRLTELDPGEVGARRQRRDTLAGKLAFPKGLPSAFAFTVTSLRVSPARVAVMVSVIFSSVSLPALAFLLEVRLALESEAVARDRHAVQRHDAAAAPKNAAVELPVRLLDPEPARPAAWEW